MTITPCLTLQLRNWHAMGFPTQAHVYVSAHWHAVGVEMGAQALAVLSTICDGTCAGHVMNPLGDDGSVSVTSTVPPSSGVQVGAESTVPESTPESNAGPESESTPVSVAASVLPLSRSSAG